VVETKQPKPTFFIDRNIGTQIVPNAIRELGYSVVTHDEVFPQDTKDIEWLSVVGKHRWPIISLDRNITTNLAEIQALITARVHAFFVNIRSPNGPKVAKSVVAAIPAIIQIVQREQPPLIATIDINGKIRGVKGYDAIMKDMDDKRARLHLS
jgi:PIN like domain